MERIRIRLKEISFTPQIIKVSVHNISIHRSTKCNSLAKWAFLIFLLANSPAVFCIHLGRLYWAHYHYREVLNLRVEES